jgi:hypothetical protein
MRSWVQQEQPSTTIERPFQVNDSLHVLVQHISIGAHTYTEQAKLLKSAASNIYCKKTSMVKDKLGEFLKAVKSLIPQKYL